MYKVFLLIVFILIPTLFLYSRRKDIPLFILRYLSYLTIVLLFLNWQVTQVGYKPLLTVLVDTSLSMTTKWTWAEEILKKLENLKGVRTEFVTFSGEKKGPGTLKPTIRETDITKALLFARGDAVFLLSDGNHNGLGYPEEAASKLGIPVYTMIPSLREYREIFIKDIDYAKLVPPNSRNEVKLTIGYLGSSKVEGQLYLTRDGKTLEEKNISITTDTTITMDLEVGGEGFYNYKLSILVENDENPLNNEREFSFKVTRGEKNVLLVSSHPSPLVKFIRYYFEETGRYSLYPIIELQKGNYRRLGENVKKNVKPVIDDADILVLIDPSEESTGFLDERTIPILVFLGENSFRFLKALGVRDEIRVVHKEVNILFKEDDIFPNKEERFPPLGGVLVFKPPPGYIPIIETRDIKPSYGNYPLLFQWASERNLFVFTTEDFWKIFLLSPEFFRRVLSFVLEESKSKGEFFVDINKTTVTGDEPLYVSAETYTEEGIPMEDVWSELLVGKRKIPMNYTGRGKFLSPPLYLEPGEHNIFVIFKKGDAVVKKKNLHIKVTEGSIESYELGVDSLTLKNIAEQSGGKYINTLSVLKEDIKEIRSHTNRSIYDYPIVFFLLILFLSTEWFIRRKRGLL